jgi:type II secretory pathway pseudopilin PulG
MTTGERGFSLVEAMVAMGILATGLLGMAGLFTVGLTQMATSSANLIAREKAREAVESVHTARDTMIITWSQINNVSGGGVFLDGAQPMYKSGTDGLVNTADDSAAGLEEIVTPGPDGMLGTADDVHTPLKTYTRQVAITSLLDQNGDVNPNLRQIVVTVTYSVGPIKRTYTLTTYISSIS